ncbi:hypothetical protein GUJ93_ZPchr0002g23001 [Zizania palustris]|uniref:Mediator of RNA polymerase II transcription subunit 14 n=1 Tax=Zizania palustris TaxID=103762 RepID=A0A8J5S6I1_ZIZPA|nr:hypothetical protein GUJ93_ZPchr0002g23001 [Zizania palustris]
MAGELGQQTVELGAVVRRAAEESYLALRELVEKSRAEAEGKGPGGAYGGRQRSDSEKKIDLLKFIARTRQRMLRLHVLAKWCQQGQELKSYSVTGFGNKNNLRTEMILTQYNSCLVVASCEDSRTPIDPEAGARANPEVYGGIAGGSRPYTTRNGDVRSELWNAEL